MTQKDLIRKWAKDCDLEIDQIEDLLLSLRELIVDAIKKGERLNLGFGALFAVPRRELGKVRAFVHFKASPDLVKALGGVDKFPAAGESDICPTCKLRPVQRSKECSTCLYHRWMKKRGHTVKPRRAKP